MSENFKKFSIVNIGGSLVVSETKLHYYYCLMFSGDEPWSKVVVDTIKNFEFKAAKHADSKTHLKNSKMLQMLGRNWIELCLPETL